MKFSVMGFMEHLRLIRHGKNTATATTLIEWDYSKLELKSKENF
jgi:hypothetical protein